MMAISETGPGPVVDAPARSSMPAADGSVSGPVNAGHHPDFLATLAVAEHQLCRHDADQPDQLDNGDEASQADDAPSTIPTAMALADVLAGLLVAGQSTGSSRVHGMAGPLQPEHPASRPLGQRLGNGSADDELPLIASHREDRRDPQAAQVRALADAARGDEAGAADAPVLLDTTSDQRVDRMPDGMGVSETVARDRSAGALPQPAPGDPRLGAVRGDQTLDRTLVATTSDDRSGSDSRADLGSRHAARQSDWRDARPVQDVADSSGASAWDQLLASTAPRLTVAGMGHPASARVSATDRQGMTPPGSVLDQVIGHLAGWNGAAGSTSLVIQLSPPDLGTVRVQFVAAGDRLRLHFRVEDTAVRAAIEGGWNDLRQVLQARGVLAEHFVVEVGAGSSGGSSAASSDQGGGSRGGSYPRDPAHPLAVRAPAAVHRREGHYIDCQI